MGVLMNTVLDWEAHKIKLAKSLHETLFKARIRWIDGISSAQ